MYQCPPTHLKIFLPFPYMEMFSWFKRIKNRVRIAIWQSTCCRWIVQQSYDSVLLITHLWHCLVHSLQHFSSWTNGCSKETNAHCVLPHLVTQSTKSTNASVTAFVVIHQGFPTFFWPCTHSTFQHMIMYPFSISKHKHVPLQHFDRWTCTPKISYEKILYHD